MSISVSLFMGGWVVGSMMVAANPAPFFGALGLVFVAGMGGCAMLLQGGSYLCFILFLAYLGGMLVVFGYSSALAADSYGDTFGSPPVLKKLVMYLLGLVIAGVWLRGGGMAEPSDFSFKLDELVVSSGDVEGVAHIYCGGGGMLMVCGWVLLIVLLVVMELVRGGSRGALRAI